MKVKLDIERRDHVVINKIDHWRYISRLIKRINNKNKKLLMLRPKKHKKKNK